MRGLLTSHATSPRATTVLHPQDTVGEQSAPQLFFTSEGLHAVRPEDPPSPETVQALRAPLVRTAKPLARGWEACCQFQEMQRLP